MGDVVNLRRFRKAKRREDESRQAAENRVAFGRTKSEKMQGDALKDLERRRLEGHRLAGDDAPDDTDRSGA